MNDEIEDKKALYTVIPTTLYKKELKKYLKQPKKIDKIEVVSISDMLADIIHANNVGDSVTEVIRKYRFLDYTDK